MGTLKIGVFPTLTVVSGLIGSGLLLAGLTIHPLIEIESNLGDEVKQISIWSVTTGNKTQTWQQLIGSPSPMPIEVGAACLLTALTLSLSSFFKFVPATRLVAAHGLLLASFFATASIASLTASFSVHHKVTPFYPMWLAVSGTAMLMAGGLIGLVGRQMTRSSRQSSLSNIVFVILAISTVALFFTAFGLNSFGDTSQYCKIPELGLCQPYEPATKLGLFRVCVGKLHSGEMVDETCGKWPEQIDTSFNWVLEFVAAFYFIAGVSMIVALVMKLLRGSLRGVATTFVVISMGSSIIAQCVISTFLSAYFHRFSKPYNELRYGAQMYGDAYYIGLAGLITSCITLASVLGEENPADKISVK